MYPLPLHREASILTLRIFCAGKCLELVPFLETAVVNIRDSGGNSTGSARNPLPAAVAECFQTPPIERHACKALSNSGISAGSVPMVRLQDACAGGPLRQYAFKNVDNNH